MTRWLRAVATACVLSCPALVTALEVPLESPGRSPGAPAPQFSSSELEVRPSLRRFESGSSGAAERIELQPFFRAHTSNWEVRWDARNDRPHLIQGAGVPLIPGRGNSLDRAELGLGPFRTLDAADIEPLLRRFIKQFPELFATGGEELVLDRESSIPYGQDQYLWNIELQQVHEGVPVEGAKVFFRINHGNIVQFGSDSVGEVRIGARPEVPRSTAFRAALRAAGFTAEALDETPDRGTLKLFPAQGPEERPGEPYIGAQGQGYRHRLAWQFVFRRAGDPRTYRALVDAHSGEVLELTDTNLYADALVQGGIYPVTNTDTEVLRPFGFATVTNNGTKNTNAAGIYNYTSSPATSATVTLNGQFFQMSDACGAISLSNSVDGNLNFGTSGGTDCTTPGVGGSGNTHASRSGFYHLTRINRKAITYLPGNSWLGSKVVANMNINNTCNAFWNGSTVNFYRSGGGCSNTGELAAVFLHEWGHGMDTNSGGSAPADQGTGEAVGDTFAFLETRDGCIGQNFLPGSNCANCTDCTGVRDVSDFDSTGPAVIARPSTVTDNAGINCDRFLNLAGAVNCPYRTNQGLGSLYRGPMGYQGHCESLIAGSANWDLAQSLVAVHGTDGGWAQMDKIWYGSLTPSKSAYQVTSGGQCNPNASVDGCGGNNWYTVFLTADDDDGNLGNGTPNGCRIWDAFDAHGIACGSRPVCSVGPTPTPTSTPTAQPTSTHTSTPTSTPTLPPTFTVTPTFSPVPTATLTPTATPVSTDTPTPTATPVSTDTPAPTITPTATDTPTNLPVPTATQPESVVDTPTPMSTASPTRTPTSAPPTDLPAPRPLLGTLLLATVAALAGIRGSRRRRQRP